MQYGRPFLLDCVGPDEAVYILDYSIEPEEMVELCLRTENVVWIDHHRTALEKYQPYLRDDNSLFRFSTGASDSSEVVSILGYREVGRAACVLTWQWFYGRQNRPPWWVKFIGDRDVWAFEFGDETRLFYAGMCAEDTGPMAETWDKLADHRDYYLTIIANGHIVSAYRDSWHKAYRENWAFEATIEGHAALCMNLAQAGSEAFGEEEGQWPILCAFVFDGKQYTVSLYSESIDVGRIAEKFGGGGHPGAAGFQTEYPPCWLAACTERTESEGRQSIRR